MVDDDLAEIKAASEERRRHLFELRGEYLSDMNNLEGFMDSVLVAYFNPKNRDVFVAQLLARMNPSWKIEAIKELLEGTPFKARFPHLIRALSVCNEYRNNLAHSHVGYQIPEPGAMQGLSPTDRQKLLRQWQSVRQSKEGRTAVPAETLEVVEHQRAVDYCRWHLLRMFFAFQEHAAGRNGLIVLNEMDLSTPIDSAEVSIPESWGWSTPS